MRISDWSSDVCSSDLEHERIPGETVAGYIARRTGCAAATSAMEAAAEGLSDSGATADEYSSALDHWLATGAADLEERRSEERRVGKEGVSSCRSRCAPTN